ncbi:hypothetical protein H257_04940 [Aphanomyces astaci]|uniref:Uncharacterized protein n=1 Tax=Aphanomyces astaci TaxID=112090 RepID=W4GRB4_APHAT|nr:hypothetical protein H257_04940 [Aphanomyces astaci]ETV82237.1 hypothetical protein H257_04940 [Aphanomyces astaci]|eukprot:XP_009827906.1 hypothetical protein H257_04940 [Aphanomyces astaci]
MPLLLEDIPRHVDEEGVRRGSTVCRRVVLPLPVSTAPNKIPPLPKRPLIITEHVLARLTTALLKKRESATYVARPQMRLQLRRQLRSVLTNRRDMNEGKSAAATVVPVLPLASKSVVDKDSSCDAAEAQRWSQGALGQYLAPSVTKAWCALRSMATSVTKVVIVV